MPGPTQTARERGFALLLVLWTLALLALIATQVTAAGRDEAQIAGNLRASALAEAAADAAVDEAAIHLLDASRERWVADGPAYVVRLPQASVQVAIGDEARLLPLNTAPVAMLAAVIRLAGAESRAADVVASQIADWRSPAPFPLKLGAKGPQYAAAGRMFGPPNRSIRSLSELRLVLGMTPELLARLAPHVSAYTESSPSAEGADPLVRAAMTEVATGGITPLAFREAGVFRVTATATSAGGGRFVRRAVIRLGGTGGLGAVSRRAFDVLAWSSGDEID